MTELVKRLGRPWTRRQIAAVVLFLLLAALLAVLFFSLRTERRLVPVDIRAFTENGKKKD